MIAYREKIIKNILKSTDEFRVRMVIDNALQKLAEKGTHPFIVLRFIDKLNASLTEIKADASEKEKNNIAQALHLLKSYDIKCRTNKNEKTRKG